MSFQDDFNAMQKARQGSVRTDVEDFVVIVHCSSYDTIESCLIQHTYYYASIYFNNRLVTRQEYDNSLTFLALMQWIAESLAQ